MRKASKGYVVVAVVAVVVVVVVVLPGPVAAIAVPSSSAGTVTAAVGVAVVVSDMPVSLDSRIQYNIQYYRVAFFYFLRRNMGSCRVDVFFLISEVK